MIIENIARIFKLLGDTSRLHILFTMEHEPKSVSQIIEATGLSQPLVSFHLKALREAGVVITHRKATLVFNALCDIELLYLIRKFSKYEVSNSVETKSFPCPPWMK